MTAAATPDPERTPGVARRTGRGHIDSYGDGRVCAAPGCTTTLSRYNKTSFCWTHDRSTFRPT
jgi:hypothetical protein